MSRHRTFTGVVAALLAGNVLLLAQAPARPARPAARRPAAAPAPVLVGSIKEIMDGLIDPAADHIFDAVSYTVTTAGIEEVRPRTREDWAEVRRHALLLAEAANLLKMPGRRVAPGRPVIEFEVDEVLPEDLTPEQVQVLIDADPAEFARLAQGLTEASVVALRAADAMDVEALFESGEALDQACENCHVKYWYPKEKPPALDALSQRRK